MTAIEILANMHANARVELTAERSMNARLSAEVDELFAQVETLKGAEDSLKQERKRVDALVAIAKVACDGFRGGGSGYTDRRIAELAKEIAAFEAQK